jgi:hypothetical protein
MIFPGHLGAGYLTAYAIIAAAGAGSLIGLGAGALSPSEIDILLVSGTLLGVAPDVDILFYFFDKKTLRPDKLSSHRTYITHAPLFWLILGMGIFSATSLLGGGAFWKIASLLVWLCPWSHLVCDSIDCGVMWLWPFSKKQYALYNAQAVQEANKVRQAQNWRELFLGYLKNPVAYVEMAITTAAIGVAILSI